MKPVEIEFLIQDHTAAGARRVAASVDRETVKLVGKIDSVQKKIEKLRASNNESLDQSENIAQIKKLEAELDRLQQKLAKASVSSKNILPKSADIDTTVRQFSGLNNSVQQLARELPALAMGPQMFFMAISNNLPIFTDELARARKEYQMLTAEGKKATPVWKQLFSSIVSWQTALAVGVMVLVSYGDEIAKWVTSLFKGKEALDAVTVATEQYNDAMAKGRVNAAKELSQAETLYKIAMDESRAMDQRREAAEQMQRLYPDYLGNLSQEAIMAGEAADAYENLKDRLVEVAQSRGAMDRLSELAAAKLSPELEAVRKASEAYDAAKRKQQQFYENYEVGEGSYLAGRSYSGVGKAKRELNRALEEFAEKYNVSGNNIIEINEAIAASEEKLTAAVTAFDSAGSKVTKKSVKTDLQGKDLYLQAVQDLEDQELAIMQEGYEKRRAEAKVQFERQLREIRQNRETLLAADRKEGGQNETRINSLFNSQIIASAQTYQNTLQSIEQAERAEAEKVYEDLLLKYESYLQKRERLAREYDRDIEALVASPEAQMEAINAKDKALQDIDVAFAEQFPQFEQWAESITTLSIEKLRDLLNEAIVELERLEGLETVNPEAETKARAAVTTLQNAITSFTDKKVAPEDDDFDRWSELSQVLARTGRDFEKLGGQVDDTLGEIIGAAGEVATSTVSAISGIKRLVKDSAAAVETTAGAAAAGMSKIERASVILTVISAAFQAFSALGGLFKNTESSLERNLRLAKEFNEELRVMNERARINRDEGSIFGDAIYNNFRENISVLRQALQDLEKDKQALVWRGNENAYGTAQSMLPWENASESIANMQVQTQHSTWFRSSKYASLRDLLPELFGEDGQINMEALQAFADESNEIFQKLSKDNQDLIKSLVEDWETYQEALAATRDYLASIFGDLGNSILDTMLAVADGTKSIEDALASQMDALSDLVRNFAKDMIYSMTLAPLLKQAQQQIEAIYASAEGTDEDKFASMLEVFSTLLSEVKGEQGTINELWEAMKAKAAEMGFDIGDQQATTQQGKAGVLSTVSQDSFTRMEGIWTAIQMHVASQDLKLDNITDLLSAQLEAMNAIVINTDTLPLTYALLKKFDQQGIMVQ